MTIEQISFDEALQKTENKKRNLLLGNGFSIAKSSKFSFENLLKKGEDQGLIDDNIVEIFKRYKSNDFEEIIKWLDDTIRTLPSKYDEIREDLDEVRCEIRHTLLEILKEVHPLKPFCDIDGSCLNNDHVTSCINFLRYFRNNYHGAIYTLNYDLLLYWVINKSCKEYNNILKADDGFRNTGKNKFPSWCHPKPSQWKQNIFYLHGGFHIIESGVSGAKKIKNQHHLTILDYLADSYDISLAVLAGNSKEKMAKINTNEYRKQHQLNNE